MNLITGDREGYSYLSFGQSDELLRGDDKTSATLKSPITIYAGDGLEGGFTFVRVRLYDSFWNPNKQPSAFTPKNLKVVFDNPLWKTYMKEDQW